KLVKNTNLKRLGILSLMVLSLSIGMVSAADDVDTSFKLWHEVVGTEETPKAVLHLEKESDKRNAVNWLVTSSSDENVKKFVEGFAKEPFKFVEGVKEARLAAKKADKFNKEFVADLTKKLNKIDEEAFGGKKAKEALMSLFK